MFNDDFESIVSGNPSENDDLLHDSDINEQKYLPEVKAEIDEFLKDGNEEQIDDDFLRSFGNDHDNGDDVGNGEKSLVNAPRYQEDKEEFKNRRPRRNVKRKIFNLEDDDSENETWSRAQQSKKKKRTSGKRGRPRKNKKSDKDDGSTVTTAKKVGRPKLTGKGNMQRMEDNHEDKCSEEPLDPSSKRRSCRNKPVREGKTKILNDEETKNNKKRGRKRKTARIEKGGAKISATRKKVADMTEEEREIMKAKWREEARIKRQRKREQMTAQEREEYLAKQRRQRAEQRAFQKVNMSEAEREEYNKKARERKRARRSLMTPEQRKEEAQKVTLRRIERLATMTEEEKQLYKMNIYLSTMARMAKMTPEEIEERRKKRMSYAKRKQSQMSEEDKAKRRARVRRYRENMSSEQKEKFLDRLRESYRKRVARLKQVPEKWEEVKEKWKENKVKRLKEMKELGANYVRKRGPRSRPHAGLNAVEREEDRKQRLRERRRHSQRKTKLKRKLAIQNLLDGGMTMEEIYKEMESPAQRERRLIRNRVNRAKQDMRKRLLLTGAPEEVIEAKLKELATTYQPTHNFRPYKSRPENWKPIDPSELALLDSDGNAIQTDLPLPELQQPQCASTATLTSIPPVTTITSTATTTVFTIAPRRIIQVIQQQPYQTIQIALPSTVTHQAQFLPPPTASPAAASTCSYVSTAETPEPIQVSLPVQYEVIQPVPLQTQPQYQYTTPAVTLQIPVAPCPSSQGQTYAFQAMLDNIGFQDPSNSSTEIIVELSENFQQQQQSLPFDQSASLLSPVEEPFISKLEVSSDDQKQSDDINNDEDEGNASTTAAPSEIVRRRGRPRKDDLPVTKSKKSSKPRHGVPRGPKKKKGQADDVNRDGLCPDCGNAYNKTYLHEHKQYFHNPNYKDSKCVLCGEKFTVARLFYSHYLKVHVKASQPEEDKPHMCDECGRCFKKQNNLNKHKYYMHGDGLQKSNYKKCPLCPQERLFKESVTFYAHLRRKHPDYQRPALHCCRCDESFSNDTLLRAHCLDKHPGCYFPCSYCDAVKFTEQGLKFHFVRCSKIPKGVLQEMRKNEEALSIERVPIPCEFCQRQVTLSSMTRHYYEMHNLREEKFECFDCGKQFKIREFWVVHMINFHGFEWNEELKEKVRVLNVKDRTGLEVKNPDGTKGGVPGNTARKLKSQERMRMKVEEKKKRGKRRTRRMNGKRGRRRKPKTISEYSDEEMSDVVEEDEEEELSSEEGTEEEEVDNVSEAETETPAPRKRKKTHRNKEREKIKDLSSNEDEEFSGEVYVPRPTVRRRGRPASSKSSLEVMEDLHAESDMVKKEVIESEEEGETVEELVPIRRGQLNEDSEKLRRKDGIIIHDDGDHNEDYFRMNLQVGPEDLEPILKMEINSDVEESLSTDVLLN